MLLESAASAATSAAWRVSFQLGLLNVFIAGPSPSSTQTTSGDYLPANPAQQAVVAALVTAVGSPTPQAVQMGEMGANGANTGPSATQIAAARQVAAAESRFAALSPAARHAWLAAHLPALRAGHVTLAQLP